MALKYIEGVVLMKCYLTLVVDNTKNHHHDPKRPTGAAAVKPLIFTKAISVKVA